MSRALDMLLDAGRLADCAANDRALALATANRAVLAADAKMTASRFRVDAEWPGGGVSRTIPVDTAAAAQAWGEYKARFHRDAVISVTPREPAPADLHFNADAQDLIQLQGFIGGLPA